MVNELWVEAELMWVTSVKAFINRRVTLRFSLPYCGDLEALCSRWHSYTGELDWVPKKHFEGSGPEEPLDSWQTCCVLTHWEIILVDFAAELTLYWLINSQYLTFRC